MPDIDIQYAVVLDSYYCEHHALKAIDQYLDDVGASAQWSDVRPVGTCAGCEADFDTTKWHKVLSVYIEEGTPGLPDVLAAVYLARFCNSCVPMI